MGTAAVIARILVLMKDIEMTPSGIIPMIAQFIIRFAKG